jgi:hypothetical protein
MAKSAAQKSTAPVQELDAMSLLMQVSTESEKKTGSKDEHKTIQIADKDVAKMVDQYVKAHADKADAEQRMSQAEELIKPYGLKQFVSDVKSGLKADRSFILANALKGLMYIVMDGYKRAGMDKDRIAYLKGKYGAGIVTTETVFEINKDLITEKNPKGVQYGAMIAQFIIGNPDIPAEVKGKLLKATPTTVIAKGTIDNLQKIATDSKVSVEELIDDIQPTQQLKQNNLKGK